MVFQWVNTRFCPRADHLKELCELLECSADELLGLPQRGKSLPEVQANRLYRAVTQEGKLSADTIHQFATALHRVAGKTTELEIWMRQIAEVLYDIALVGNEADSLCNQITVKPVLDLVQPPPKPKRKPAVEKPNINPLTLVISPVTPEPTVCMRRLDRKRRKMRNRMAQ
ncbi:MAG: hypothetical protein K0Q50_2304 [Vampirovibrio sp.]|jgi:hypothetical protein|nr:hypothetical protein [Vampirovibrio sp.]